MRFLNLVVCEQLAWEPNSLVTFFPTQFLEFYISERKTKCCAVHAEIAANTGVRVPLLHGSATPCLKEAISELTSNIQILII
jgi:hypothetical protein